MPPISVDQDKAIARLMRFLASKASPARKSDRRGCRASAGRDRQPGSAIRFDDANTKIPLPTQTGTDRDIPGTRPGPRLLFSTHLDTVPLCAGAVPIRKGTGSCRKADGTRGDNRTGVACLVTMLAELHAQKIPHGPMTVLFTVREESGLWGARTVDPKELGTGDGLQHRRWLGPVDHHRRRPAPIAGSRDCRQGGARPASIPNAGSPPPSSQPAPWLQSMRKAGSAR